MRSEPRTTLRDIDTAARPLVGGVDRFGLAGMRPFRNGNAAPNGLCAHLCAAFVHTGWNRRRRGPRCAGYRRPAGLEGKGHAQRKRFREGPRQRKGCGARGLLHNPQALVAAKAGPRTEKSAALRDQLVQELVQFPSSEQATEWAQRALGAENTLRGSDAAIVEAAFASRLAELTSSGSVEDPPPSSSGGGHGGDATLAETAETPNRIALLAALEASVELSAAGRRSWKRDFRCAG
jgi:hypothetical protein